MHRLLTLSTAVEGSGMWRMPPPRNMTGQLRMVVLLRRVLQGVAQVGPVVCSKNVKWKVMLYTLRTRHALGNPVTVCRVGTWCQIAQQG